jgi:hypothetical protein
MREILLRIIPTAPASSSWVTPFASRSFRILAPTSWVVLLDPYVHENNGMKARPRGALGPRGFHNGYRTLASRERRTGYDRFLPRVGSCVVMRKSHGCHSEPQAKNLTIATPCKCEILRLAPQDDIVTQSLAGEE